MTTQFEEFFVRFILNSFIRKHLNILKLLNILKSFQTFVVNKLREIELLKEIKALTLAVTKVTVYQISINNLLK